MNIFQSSVVSPPVADIGESGVWKIRRSSICLLSLSLPLLNLSFEANKDGAFVSGSGWPSWPLAERDLPGAIGATATAAASWPSLPTVVAEGDSAGDRSLTQRTWANRRLNTLRRMIASLSNTLPQSRSVWRGSKGFLALQRFGPFDASLSYLILVLAVLLDGWILDWGALVLRHILLKFSNTSNSQLPLVNLVFCPHPYSHSSSLTLVLDVSFASSSWIKKKACILMVICSCPWTAAVLYTRPRST